MTRTAGAPFASALRTGWQVIRHELMYVFWALMEVALVTPLFLALAPWTVLWSPSTTALWLLFIMLIPFNLIRFASVLRLPVERQHIIMVFSLVLVLVFSWRILLYSTVGFFDLGWLANLAGLLGDGANPRWPRVLALFMITVLMWWRGISLAGRGVDYRDVGLRMRLGVLLAVFFVAGFANSQLAWSVTPFILLFFFASLASIILTRVKQLEMSRSGRSFPGGLLWLLTVLGVAALVVFATGIIAGLLSGDSIQSIAGWLAPFWVALRFALTAVVYMLGLIISPILVALITFVQWLLGPLGAPAGNLLDDLRDVVESFQQIQSEEEIESPEFSLGDYRQLLAGLTMLFVILLVSLALRRLFRMIRPVTALPAHRVSPFSGVGPSPQGNLGQRILDRLNLFRRRRAAASIRQTYRAMCATAAERSFPRAESETAYEYLPTLALAFPGQTAETELITEAYNRAHYGELPESDEELALILDAWQRLSSSERKPPRVASPPSAS